MKEITDEYLLSLVQKEEYAVMGGKLIMCTFILKNGSLVSGDPVYISDFDKAQDATKKSAISKLKILEEYLVRDKLNQVNTMGCFLEQTQRNYLDLMVQTQALCVFMTTDLFHSLVQAERELILEQHEAMHKFSRILLKRINIGK
jgi:hypothetical protein